MIKLHLILVTQFTKYKGTQNKGDFNFILGLDDLKLLYNEAYKF